MSPDSHAVNTVVHVVDGAAALVMVASLASVIPAVAGIFTIVWTGLRIYEMVTGQRFAHSLIAKWITGRA